MGFYFVQPPDLEPIEQAGIRLSSPRRQARREAASRLREANPLIREDLLGWVRGLQGRTKDDLLLSVMEGDTVSARRELLSRFRKERHFC